MEIEGCQQVLHVPFDDFQRAFPTKAMSAAVLFTPSRGKLALMLIAEEEMIAKWERLGVVGEPLVM